MNTVLKQTLPQNNTGLFSNKALQRLIIPLVIEQVLVILVGVADTMLISRIVAGIIMTALVFKKSNAVYISVKNVCRNRLNAIVPARRGCSFWGCAEFWCYRSIYSYGR